MRLDGKVAVITGAASGFGEGLAKRFAAEGAKIMVADINDNGSAGWLTRLRTKAAQRPWFIAMSHQDQMSTR